MKRLTLLSFSIFTALTAATVVAQPLQAPIIAGLLPTDVARPLLEQDPRVAAARASLEVARQESNLLGKSPYEWIGKAQGQRRSVDDGARYIEWNVGIERTLRLGDKGAADRNLGQATTDEADARYAEALHESARELAALWVDWLAAERGRALAAENLSAVQENLRVVERRNRAGDASRLDMNLASADLADQKRIDNDAQTVASAAWARLSTRFPGISRQSTPVPRAGQITESESVWRERILAASEAVRLAQIQVRMAQAQADRARAERVPDPTLGVFAASEGGGREQIVGVTLSIPIPGGLRATRSAKTLAAVDVARNAVELKQRELEDDIATALATARGSYTSLQMADESTAAMQQNARLVQRAYTLGEGDLQTLLLARRQATAAANSALQASVSALKAYLALLIDAHLVWELNRN